MTWSAALGASLLIVLARPGLWVIALGGFLVRGGILVFFVPIVALPSPVGLATAFGPTITTLVLSGPTPALLLAITLLAVVIALVFFLATWAAALAERALILALATDDELPDEMRIGTERGPSAWRLVAVRLAAQLPLWVVLALTSSRIVELSLIHISEPTRPY